jgi:ribosomal protein S12 methylthiotransferase
MRGKHVSKHMEELVKEAAHLAASGTKELVIIAQDSTYYGLDIYGERRLAELLRKLSEVEGIEWIRLHYAFPAGFPEDVLHEMATNPKICKYLDIPLQHISDSVLKSMRRGTTREKTYRLLQNMREKVPGIAIRTTLITGYPGETEADFEQLCQFVRDIRFDRLGVFTYSHEENTHAYSLADDVPEETKKERANKIMEIQREIAESLNAEKIGKTFRVLFDKTEAGYFVGRTQFDSPDVDNEVLVPVKNNYVRMGDFAQVTITDAREYDLFGDIAE